MSVLCSSTGNTERECRVYLVEAHFMLAFNRQLTQHLLFHFLYEAGHVLEETEKMKASAE
jgi:hypothetical protein